MTGHNCVVCVTYLILLAHASPSIIPAFGQMSYTFLVTRQLSSWFKKFAVPSIATLCPQVICFILHVPLTNKHYTEMDLVAD